MLEKKGETMKERNFNKGDIVALHFSDASSIGYNGVVAIVKGYFYDKVVNEWKYLCDSKYGSSSVWAFENEMILQK